MKGTDKERKQNYYFSIITSACESLGKVETSKAIKVCESAQTTQAICYLASRPFHSVRLKSPDTSSLLVNIQQCKHIIHSSGQTLERRVDLATICDV